MTDKKSTRKRTTRQSLSRRRGLGPRLASVSTTLHDQIAVRAYEIYERRIWQGPLDDWLQAEQEILGQQEAGC